MIEPGPKPSDDAADSDTRAAGVELGFQLRGDLPCVRCGYDLGGLSIRGVCPECGTPIRATLLVVVDPHARELQPVHRPALVVAGLLAWSVGALAAAMVGWWVRVGSAVDLPGTLEVPVRWAREGALVCLVISGIGSLALIRPHARIVKRNIVAAALATAGYVPLAVLGAWVWAGRPAGVTGAAPPVEWTLARLAFAGVFALVLIGQRPNARLLAARSLLLRSGRVDRQTMYAMAAAVGVVGAGHGVNLLAVLLHGRALDVALSAGTVLVAVGWMLVTIGFVGVVVDVVRLCPVLLEPSPTLGSLLSRGSGGAAVNRQGRERFDALFDEVVEDLPARVRGLLEEIPVIVMDRPSPAMLRDVGIDPTAPGAGDDLCGLHTGTAITERSIEVSGDLPTEIHLFREGIVSLAGGWDQELSGDEVDDEVYEEIRITLLHEIGHHFGLEEDDLADLGYD